MPATGCAIDLEALEEVLALRGISMPEATHLRVVVAGAVEHRRAHAARLRRAGATVAEVDSTERIVAERYARAHGYVRVVLCDERGAACEHEVTR